MSQWQAFLWGAVAGAVAALVIYALPSLKRGMADGELHVTKTALMCFLGVGLLLTLVAGLSCLIPHRPSLGQCILIGFGVDGTLRGIAAAGADAFPGVRPLGS